MNSCPEWVLLTAESLSAGAARARPSASGFVHRDRMGGGAGGCIKIIISNYHFELFPGLSGRGEACGGGSKQGHPGMSLRSTQVRTDTRVSAHD